MDDQQIRVLIVDDSPLIRQIMSDLIEAAPGVSVAGTAENGKEALKEFERLQPDVITLDIQMPVMDGLQTLQAILEIKPVPIIMVSAQTSLGASITLQALEKGAMDYISKPEGVQHLETLAQDLLRKIRTFAGTNVQRVLETRKLSAQRRQQRIMDRKQHTASLGSQIKAAGDSYLHDKVIALGISTGGPTSSDDNL